MKLKITLKPNSNYLIYDYKYYVSSWLYNTLAKSNPEYANELHNDISIKFFTFSNLFFKRADFFEDHIEIKDSLVNLYITSYNDIFTKSLISGLLDSKLVLGTTIFTPIKIRKIPVETYHGTKNEFMYKSLAPISVSVANYNGVPIYCPKPSEELFYKCLIKNLEKKYEKIHGKKYLGDLVIKPDGNKLYSKLYSVKTGKIKGFEMGFKIKCSEPMRKIILTAGLGEKNSLGFGMVDIRMVK